MIIIQPNDSIFIISMCACGIFTFFMDPTKINVLRTFGFTLKAPITTAADGIHKYFSFFSEKIRLHVQVNPLLGREFT